MTIEKLLDDFVELENDLNIQGVSEKLLVLRKMSVTILKCYQLQLDYVDQRASFGEHVDILEASKAFMLALNEYRPPVLVEV
jgi:hypothetical protein